MDIVKFFIKLQKRERPKKLKEESLDISSVSEVLEDVFTESLKFLECVAISLTF